MPDWTIGAMSVENVSGEVMTSSPGSRPSRSMASRSADEPELTITPCCLASSSATRRSMAATDAPEVERSLVRSTSTTASISSLVVDRAGAGQLHGPTMAGMIDSIKLISESGPCSGRTLDAWTTATSDGPACS